MSHNFQFIPNREVLPTTIFGPSYRTIPNDAPYIVFSVKKEDWHRTTSPRAVLEDPLLNISGGDITYLPCFETTLGELNNTCNNYYHQMENKLQLSQNILEQYIDELFYATVVWAADRSNIGKLNDAIAAAAAIDRLCARPGDGPSDATIRPTSGVPQGLIPGDDNGILYTHYCRINNIEDLTFRGVGYDPHPTLRHKALTRLMRDADDFLIRIVREAYSDHQKQTKLPPTEASYDEELTPTCATQIGTCCCYSLNTDYGPGFEPQANILANCITNSTKAECQNLDLSTTDPDRPAGTRLYWKTTFHPYEKNDDNQSDDCDICDDQTGLTHIVSCHKNGFPRIYYNRTAKQTREFIANMNDKNTESVCYASFHKNRAQAQQEFRKLSKEGACAQQSGCQPSPSPSCPPCPSESPEPNPFESVEF